jgi:hypothetical protein
LLFSDPGILSSVLHISKAEVDSIINHFGDPEKINDSPETCPSKRLEALYPRFKKTSTGITIAQNIGIDLMRGKCHVFNNWITRLENCVK